MGVRRNSGSLKKGRPVTVIVAIRNLKLVETSLWLVE